MSGWSAQRREWCGEEREGLLGPSFCLRLRVLVFLSGWSFGDGEFLALNRCPMKIHASSCRALHVVRMGRRRRPWAEGWRSRVLKCCSRALHSLIALKRSAMTPHASFWWRKGVCTASQVHFPAGCLRHSPMRWRRGVKGLSGSGDLVSLAAVAAGSQRASIGGNGATRLRRVEVRSGEGWASGSTEVQETRASGGGRRFARGGAGESAEEGGGSP
mmetsp:Transcript_47023/g.112001  ORF Transcript_47023/g.112001 Transcript_47023/m.112001 type:complete len:216 (-) Transcript_47023:71-718(-)